MNDVLQCIFTFLVTLGVMLFCINVVNTKLAEEEASHGHSTFELIGYSQTLTRNGNPRFLKFVKYTDGCERCLDVSAEEYFENKE